MRSATLLMGTLGVVACSLDHVRVAALDDAGSANMAGAVASSGSSSLSPSAGAGALNSGGAPPQDGEDRFILISGGSTGDVHIDGDAGTTSEVVCSCLGSRQAQLCGSDGVTYPASCDDAGTCLLPAIACFHACPCLAGESANLSAISWFPQDCVSTAPCSDGLICMTFSDLMLDGRASCADAGN
jgi:hypothetical protein